MMASYDIQFSKKYHPTSAEISYSAFVLHPKHILYIISKKYNNIFLKMDVWQFSKAFCDQLTDCIGLHPTMSFLYAHKMGVYCNHLRPSVRPSVGPSVQYFSFSLYSLQFWTDLNEILHDESLHTVDDPYWFWTISDQYEHSYGHFLSPYFSNIFGFSIFALATKP